jgi:hypothetical protein
LIVSDDLPGFIDDEPKPKKPATPAAPAAGFNAFDDVKVDASPLSLAKPSAPSDKAAPAKAAPGKPTPSKPAAAGGFNAFADADSAPSEANEADIKPGQGKDLWPCPHCEAKNKPDRTTCRACGKDPKDPVVIPFHRTPAGRIGIPAGVVVVILLLGWMLFGGSVSLATAEPGSIDSAIRHGGSTAGEVEIAGMSFRPDHHAAVCGRVLGMGSYQGFGVTVLALGSEAKDADACAALTVDMTSNPPSVSGDGNYLTLYTFGNLPEGVSRGQILSLLGDQGRLVRDGTFATDFDGGTVFRIQQSR